MPDRFRGRTAVVTGASRGIGAALAQRLAAEGANLALVARTLDHHPTLPGSLQETAAICRAHGVNVHPIVADASVFGSYAQAIDTVRCLDEGVVTHPADADIGSVFGWGFPPYTGGTISYIETVGLPAFVTEADRLAATYGDRFAVPDSLRDLAASGETFYSRAAAPEQKSAA